jgi:hypothetical protein
MDLYHIWCDLKPGVSDLEFCESVERYLGRLEERGEIEGFRITRRKLGLGFEGLREFHIMVEASDLAQLERAFQDVAARGGEVEGFHAAVNQSVTGLRTALYRDFPDSVRKRGEERF